MSVSTTFTGRKSFSHIHQDQTEGSVGKAIKESGIPREEIFVTTKLTESHHHPDHVQTALEHSLKNLGLEYVDLYLIHWPFATEFDGFEFNGLKSKRVNVPIIDTWRAMEGLVDAGLARSIGVSNFTIPLLDDLLSQATIPPAVNQVELRKMTRVEWTGGSDSLLFL
jgi:diketogulonate reductase-like aldo/keto reductase